MQQEEEQHFIDELKQFVTENFPLSRMSNEELEDRKSTRLNSSH